MERGNARLKVLDRYLGPLLLLSLFPLRLFRPARIPERIRSVGLLKTAAIGDTVLLSAIVSDFRRRDPAVRIVLFAGASNAGFAKRIAGIDRLVEIPLKNPLKCVELVRSERFDLFCDFDSWPRISALLASSSRASLRLGFETAGQRRHYMYDLPVPHRADRHELDNYREFLSLLGLEAASPPQDFGHPWQRSSEDVVFHLWPSGTRSHLKEWSAAKWSELARRLLALGDFRFVVTGGAEDVERSTAFVASLPADLKPRFSCRAGTSFDDTLRLLAGSRLLVSVNTGIMHVGAAMGVPTVGLHGPTNPMRWGPVGRRVRSVSSRLDGAGRLNLGFEYLDEINYMDGLDIDEVFQACQSLLAAPVGRGDAGAGDAAA